MSAAKNLASIHEISTKFGISERTVRRWIEHGTVTGYRMGPRLIRVDVDEVYAMFSIIPPAEAGEA